MGSAEDWSEVGERIAETRLAAGLSQGELASRVGLERTALVRAEAGERKISALELFRLSEALGVPPAHFVSRPPAPLVSRRRALEDNADAASRDRYRLDARLEGHARNARWLVAHRFLLPPSPSVTPAGGEKDPATLARRARHALGATAGPLGPMADVAEEFGLFLTAVDEPAEGASLLLDGYGVAVLSSRADPGRRRWTAAHELGHHLLQDEYHSDAGGVAASREEREQAIDRFAEEFLLPEADLRNAWRRRGPDDTPRSTLIGLSARYRLSWGAVVTKARRLGLIDGAEARRLRARSPVLGDFLGLLGSAPVPDLEAGTTGVRWRRAVFAAWKAGAVAAARAVELLYGAVGEDDLPEREAEDVLP